MTEAKFSSILCLNGRLPNKSWFAKQHGTPIITADGASNKLIDQDIIPNFIIGDLDSIEIKHLTNQYNILHIADQNTTDFEKCLLEMEKQSLFPSLILGIGGGEIDHTIYNLNCFMRYAKKHQLTFLDIDENKKMKYGIPVFDKHEFYAKIGTTISLMPFPEATVSTTGLKWELNKSHLSITTNASVRNSVSNELVTIHIHDGAVLAIVDEIRTDIDLAL